METVTRSESVRFGNFELDLRTRELLRNGSRLKIRGHPVDVLAILVEHPGELVTRETLQKRLWPDNTFVDFEQILNNSVGKLRDALGDRPEAPRFIETLPRLGYRFIAPVESPADQVETSSATPESPQPPDTEHRFTSKRWILWPALGFAVAFAVFAYGYLHLPLPAPRITDYKMLTLDGQEKIVHGTDGTRLYLNLVEGQGTANGIAEVPITGGQVRQIPINLPSESGPSAWFWDVSPDGSSLLVQNGCLRDGCDVWIVGIRGYPARRLVRAYTAAWSPDGKTVAYASGHGDIYAVGLDGGEPRLLLRVDSPSDRITRTHDMSWSPDGRTIRFTRWGGKIWEMTSTGANPHELFPGSIRRCCGRWTADGQFFVFLMGPTQRMGPSFWPLAQIWAVDERRRRMRPPRSEPILLASGPLLWSDPVPSRDGEKIFARGVSLRGELERHDQKSNRLEPYLNGISADMADFSRDGKYVAYVSFPEGILWRANRDGSSPVQLTKGLFHPRAPHWSPDGERIIFTDKDRDLLDGVYAVSSRGGTPKRLIPEDNGPQDLADWSPDGKRVVYSTAPWFSHGTWDTSKVETRILDLATRTTVTLPSISGGVWGPRWSPDGRYIAGLTSNGYELAVFDLKAQAWMKLLPKGRIGFPTWTHDGRFICFVRRTSGHIGIYRIPVESPKEELVAEPPQGFRGTGWYGFWMSLDPSDAPLLLRDAGTDEIYALTLERK